MVPKNIKGTKTEKNLLGAFAGESQARNRYTYFASQAKKEGYEQISAIFLDTAENEKEHAKRFFGYLQGGDVTIEACFPAGVVGTTKENLKAAAAGEHHEWAMLYQDFAKDAENEGFPEISALFRNISKAEQSHEGRYLHLHENLEKGTAFKRDKPVKWRCRNCGFVHEGTDAPKICPACLHPQSYYEVYLEKF